MIGTGTFVNVAAILIGSTIGILLKKGLKERFRNTIMQALGLATMFIGLSGALRGLLSVDNEILQSDNTMIMILSLAVGALIGEGINIEEKLEKLGILCKKTLRVKGEKGENFVEGFVTSSLLVCVGAMAIVGSLQDGLTGDASMLYAKSLIDGVAVIIFASTLGIGVYFSAIPLAIYQGAITLSAKAIEPFLTDRLILNMSFVGSILIFGIGVNMLFGNKIKVGNLLPAVLIPVIYEFIAIYII